MSEYLNYISNEYHDFGTDAPYDVLNELPFGNAVINYYRNIWEQTGFLEEYDGNKDELSMAYTNLAYFCLFDYRHNEFADKFLEYDMDFDVIAFPLVRCVLDDVNDFNFEKFLTYLRKIDVDIDKMIEIADENGEEDLEAMMLRAIADVIIDEFEKDSEAYRKRQLPATKVDGLQSGDVSPM